jgi:hypothetical protein
MQPLTWYVRRARTMSAAELLWRTRSVVRDAGDHVRIPLGLVPSSVREETAAAPPLPLIDVRAGEWLTASGREAHWRDRLVERASRAVDHRASFFELDDHPLGTPIQWNFDYVRARPTPMAVACGIDYRDYRVTGDCKVVWEPSRHHQLVVLGRAYRATGDDRYAREVAAQIESWIDQCPFGRGMQWRSPLELAIRAINWTWADHLVRGSDAFTPERRARFLDSLNLHVWDISRKFSQGSSANNHAIGEAAGVFVAACCYPGLDSAPRWRRESASILEREILAQTYADGGSREQAFGYHGFVLQFLLAAAIVGRRAGTEFSAAYWTRLERMLDFACAMVEGGPAPMFGDADDGYVLDLGAAPGDVRDLVAIGAAVFGRSDFKAAASGHEEAVRWLLGQSGLARLDALDVPSRRPLVSRAFPDSGYYLLQSGDAASPDGISAVFDCGELGFTAIAAHGHADALSVMVRAGGEDLLVDPGTYDYFTFPEWRGYFRSTPAHNTVAIDGENQSVMLGPFLWGARAAARCTEWEPSSAQTVVAGEHDGYARLPDPVIHRRRLSLDRSGRMTIADHLIASAGHDVALYFHAADQCTVEQLGANVFLLRGNRVEATLVVDPALAVTTLRAAEAPAAGWVSRRYHRKSPSTTMVGACRVQGAASFVCTLEVKSIG